MTRNAIKMVPAGLALAILCVTAANAAPDYNSVNIKYENTSTQPVWVTLYAGSQNMEAFCLQAGNTVTHTIPDFGIAENGSKIQTLFEYKLALNCIGSNIYSSGLSSPMQVTGNEMLTVKIPPLATGLIEPVHHAN